jgi:hypothetical protein
MRITLFKLPGHRVFNHLPIYYNQEAEKQKERERNARIELGLPVNEDGTSVASRIKGKMREKRASQFTVAYKERKKSNWRLLAIVIVLMVLAYYLLSTSGEWLGLVTK